MNDVNINNEKLLLVEPTNQNTDTESKGTLKEVSNEELERINNTTDENDKTD